MGWLADTLRPRRRALTSSAVADAVLERGRLARRSGLTASAAIITPAEGVASAKRRRAWQDDAFAYRRAVPEVGYVTRWLGNNSAHIRLTVGDRPPGVDEVAELDDTYPLDDPDALPADLVEAAVAALSLLTGSAPSGGGAAILSPIVTSYEVVGECYLVGRYDPAANAGAGRETWAVHSIREVTFDDGKMPGSPDTLEDGSPFPRGYYRLVTGEGRQAEAVNLDPRFTTVVRLWTADSEWSAEPDAPLRSLGSTCAQLLMIERGRMAAFRSRAAGNGVLLMPEELTQPPGPDEPEDAPDPFDRDFTTQLTTPLTQDGSAAQVVPQVYRGAAQYLAAIRLLTFDRPLDPLTSEVEARLLARLGTGLDVPPEVITGLSDVNHWNAWQISSDTFKHHQEPITIDAVEALTLGYLRPRLRAAGRWVDDLIDRVVLWYDPSNLIAAADMSGTANDAYDRGLITDRAYRQLRGIDESMAPEEPGADAAAPVGTTGLDAALLDRVAVIAGNLLRAGYEPQAVTQALGLSIAHTGIVPGVAPAEVPAVEPPTDDAEQPPEVEPVAAALAVTAHRVERRAITAAADDDPGPSRAQRRASRRLATIEQQLRDRIAVAAAAAITRALERAGNRVRATGQRDEAVREATAGVPGDRVVAAVGRVVVAALGLDEVTLLAEAFTRLREQFIEWTTAAGDEAAALAARIAGLDLDDPAVADAVGALRSSYATGAVEAWPVLEQALAALATERMYDPDPAAPAVGEVPNVIVPPGLVRQALAVAGGLPTDHDGRPPLPGLTSGELLGRFLRSSGCEVASYEWAYGISARPFPPHQRLDGVEFAGFDDDRLSTRGTGHEWIGGSFVPGDHKGCHCDALPVWRTGERAREQLEAIGRRAYIEQNDGRQPPARRATVDPDVYFDPAPLPPLRRA